MYVGAFENFHVSLACGTAIRKKNEVELAPLGSARQFSEKWETDLAPTGVDGRIQAAGCKPT